MTQSSNPTTSRDRKQRVDKQRKNNERARLAALAFGANCYLAGLPAPWEPPTEMSSEQGAVNAWVLLALAKIASAADRRRRDPK